MTTTGVPSGLSLVGHAVFDAEGAEVGEVAGVYLDNRSRRPEWAAVRRVGGGITVVPLAGAAIYEDSLEVPFTSEQVEAAPYRRMRPAPELSEDEEAELYRHYDEGAGGGGAATASRETASSAKQHGRQVAETAADQGQGVASSAAEQGRQVVATAKERASAVAEGASAQARGVLEETTSRLQSQAASGLQRAAENLGNLADECAALAEGRPEDAPAVAGYVRQAADRLLEVADRVDGVADHLEARGFAGVLEDVGGFARRRPGLFLLATTGIGFVAGRALRSAQAQDEESGPGDSQPEPALDPAALDALSRRVWPGERGERPRSARREQPLAPRS